MVKSFTFKEIKFILDKEYWKEKYKKEPMLCHDIEFQNQQLQYLFSTNDFTTIKNRINNMLKWGGIKIIN